LRKGLFLVLVLVLVVVLVVENADVVPSERANKIMKERRSC
jgi:hypothetical protein